MSVFAQMDLFEANGYSRVIWRASPDCIVFHLNIADCWCNSFFKCPVHVTMCAGGGGLQAVFVLEIPVVPNIRSIGVVHIFRHGKTHSYLGSFIFFPEGCRHSRGLLLGVTFIHTRDNSMMFVNSLSWCFRQMWWVERQEMYLVMSSSIKTKI